MIGKLVVSLISIKFEFLNTSATLLRC